MSYILNLVVDASIKPLSDMNKNVDPVNVRRLVLVLYCLTLAGGKISLIGHSAGGWLARVYMEEFDASDISLLLTLGTPHLYGFFL